MLNQKLINIRTNININKISRLIQQINKNYQHQLNLKYDNMSSKYIETNKYHENRKERTNVMKTNTKS